MVFSSPLFLFAFLPLVFAGFAIAPLFYRHAFLVVASLTFYAFGDRAVPFYLLASVALNFSAGLWIEGQHSPRRRRAILAVAVTVNLLGLAWVKYGYLLLDPTYSAAFIHGPLVVLGVSFFTLHALSYLIDVARCSKPAQRSCIDFALYLCFFPQLLAGPIIRYAGYEDQLRTQKHVSLSNLDAGLRRFIIGLGKKTLLADVFAVFADRAFTLPLSQLSTMDAWTGAVCFALQIYFDFSGYSDMAIGLARMFGFVFPENFRWPYVAHSVSDFWRRWHISLMQWLREYVYFPLGGSRVSQLRTCLNILVVFALSGLWHGTGWPFLVWGVYFGVLLSIERIVGESLLRTMPIWLRIALTQCLVLIGWVIFRSNTLADTSGYLARMSGLTSGIPSSDTYVQMTPALLIAIGVLAALPIAHNIGSWMQSHRGHWKSFLMILRDSAYVLVFVLSLSAIAGMAHTSFLYFQF